MENQKATLLHISKNVVVAIEVNSSITSYANIGYTSVTIKDLSVVKTGCISGFDSQNFGYHSFKGKTPKARLEKAFKYAFDVLNQNYFLKGKHIVELNKLFNKLA